MAYLQRQSVTTLTWAFFFFHHGISTDWNKYRYQVIWMLIDPKRNAWTKGRHTLTPTLEEDPYLLCLALFCRQIFICPLKTWKGAPGSWSAHLSDARTCAPALFILSCWAGCALPYRNHKLRTVRAHAWECDPTPSSGCQLGQAALTCCSGSGMSGV